jgi:hypothetical protein
MQINKKYRWQRFQKIGGLLGGVREIVVQSDFFSTHVEKMTKFNYILTFQKMSEHFQRKSNMHIFHCPYQTIVQSKENVSHARGVRGVDYTT